MTLHGRTRADGERTKPTRSGPSASFYECPHPWSIARFSRLTELLRTRRDSTGRVTFNVVARDRERLGQPDSILSRLDETDELWLFAVDEGDGLTPEDCGGITRFWRAGRGLFVTRDHMDLGSSLCSLGAVGGTPLSHAQCRSRPIPMRDRRPVLNPHLLA